MRNIVKKVFQLNSNGKVYTSCELLLIVYLVIFSNKQGLVINTSLQKMANTLGLSIITIMKSLKKLKRDFSIRRISVQDYYGFKINSYDASGLIKKLGEQSNAEITYITGNS